MRMYEPLIFVHSWIRWAVVVGVIYLVIRSTVGWWARASWTEQDDRFIWAFNQIFGYQILFGLTLWIALSPMTKAGFQKPSLVFQNSAISFWVLRHPMTMILALGIFHMGKARSRKVAQINRFKVYSITFLLVLIMIGSAIPWPWLSYGRSLFRWFL